MVRRFALGGGMATQALLAVQNIEVIYDHVILVLKGVSLEVQQARDRLQRGGLARAVRSKERHDLPLLHLQRYALQHEDHVVVDDLDVLYREQRLRGHAASQSKTADHRPPFYVSPLRVTSRRCCS